MRYRRNGEHFFVQISTVHFVYNPPELNRIELKNTAQGAYFALYNHDKKLLDRVLPMPLKPTTYSKDWRAEDDRLYSALSRLGNPGNSSMSALDRKVNGHGNLLRNRDRLPVVA